MVMVSPFFVAGYITEHDMTKLARLAEPIDRTYDPLFGRFRAI